MSYYYRSKKVNEIEINEEISVKDMREYFRHNNTGPYFSIFELGFADVRFDLIRIDPYRRYIRIYEFKTSRSDWYKDKKGRFAYQYRNYVDLQMEMEKGTNSISGTLAHSC